MADLSKKNLKNNKNDFFAFVAFQHYKNGELDKAIEVCEKGLRDYPAYPQAHFILGNCYNAKSQTDQARNEYERVLFYDSNHLSAIKELSEIYKSQGLDEVHDDFLFMLNTLDPLAADIIEKVKATKVYNNWEASKSKDDNTIQPDQSDTEISEDIAAATEPPADVQLPEDKSDNEEEFNSILEGIFDGAEKEADDEQTDDDYLLLDAENAQEQPQLKTEEPVETDSDIQFNAEPDENVPEKHKETDKDIQPEEKPDENVSEEAQTPEIIKEEKQAKESETIPVEQLSIDDLQNEISGMVEGYDTVFNEKIVSRTLGEILISQKKYPEAKKVFEILKQQQADNIYLDKKIKIIDQLITVSNE